MASASNAWNQYFGGSNTGNQNNNNKNNTNNRVRPVRRSTVAVTGPDITINETLNAYLDCRKRKRSKDTTTLFELNLARNLGRITRELGNKTWTPGSSMCFVVLLPKPREVWAATFADRVVHHIIYQRLRPRIEPGFAPTSFACIKNRGTLAAAAWAHQSLRRVTNGWTGSAWTLQLDIANFFPSIDQTILWQLLEPHVHEPWVARATRRIITHDVRVQAHFPGDPGRLALLEPHKSLWQAPPGKGLPIGNLTSQFAANVYLNELDSYISREIRPRFFGRYVDDIVLMDTDKNRLLEARDQIAGFLRTRLALRLHHGKTRLQPAHHGVDFVGWRLLPHRRYIRRSTSARAGLAFREHADDPDQLLASVNSYLGTAKHGNTWNLRGKWLNQATKHPALVADPRRTRAIRRKDALLRESDSR